MTITDNLQFNVLTAPIAGADRRALSQAWYSALYGSGAPREPQSSPLPRANAARPRAPHEQSMLARSELAGRISAERGKPPQLQPRAGVAVERRAARNGLARTIERSLLHPRGQTRAATLTLGNGRVRVILKHSRAGLLLVAICAPKAGSAVARALAQARYALARRGIALQTAVREAG